MENQAKEHAENILATMDGDKAIRVIEEQLYTREIAFYNARLELAAKEADYNYYKELLKELKEQK